MTSTPRYHMYQSGSDLLNIQMKEPLSPEQVNVILDVYRRKYPEVVRFWENLKRELEEGNEL